MISQPTLTNQPQQTKASESNLHQISYCEALCSSGSQAFEACISQNCIQPKRFTCCQMKCKCRLEHKLCSKIDLSSCFQLLEQKTKDNIFPKIKQTIEKTFDELFNQLSQLKDHILKQIKTHFKCIKLDPLELAFLKSTKSQSTQKISGQEMAETWKVINTPFTQQKSKQNKSQQVFMKNLTVFKEDIAKNMQKLKQVTTKFQNYQQKQQTTEVRNLFLRKEKQSKYSFMSDAIFNKKVSSILDQQSFEKAFSLVSRQIKRIDLLYKASENNFSMKKYYQICQNIPNTMIVAKTDQYPWFAAFTPIPFGLVNQPRFIQDLSKQSFLLSHNRLYSKNKMSYQQQNLILRITDQQKAVYHDQKPDAIRFGNWDFYICDWANIIKQSSFGNSQVYQNSRYNKSAQNNSKSIKCYLQEWEVFQVYFD